jgi:hypothetical protein
MKEGKEQMKWTPETRQLGRPVMIPPLSLLQSPELVDLPGCPVIERLMGAILVDSPVSDADFSRCLKQAFHVTPTFLLILSSFA